MTDVQPDPDGPRNPHAPELDLEVPVPGSPAETTPDDEDVTPDADAAEPPD